MSVDYPPDLPDETAREEWGTHELGMQTHQSGTSFPTTDIAPIFFWHSTYRTYFIWNGLFWGPLAVSASSKIEIHVPPCPTALEFLFDAGDDDIDEIDNMMGSHYIQTTSSGNSYRHKYPAETSHVFAMNKPFCFFSSIKLNDQGQVGQKVAAIGFFGTRGATDITTEQNCICFFANDSAGGADTNWFARCKSGGVATSVDTGILAANSVYKDFVISSDGSTVKFFIGSALVATISTNIPTVSGNALLYIKNTGAGGKRIYIDTYRFWCEKG